MLPLAQEMDPYALVTLATAFGGSISFWVVLILFGIISLVLVIQVYRVPPKGPIDKLVGQRATVLLAVGPGKRGKIRVYGEIWDAEVDSHTAITFKKGDEVLVSAVGTDRPVVYVTQA